MIILVWFGFLLLIRVTGQQFEQRDPDVLLPGHFHQLLLGTPRRSQAWREIESVQRVLVLPQVSSWMDVSETSPQGDVQEEPDQMLEPPDLVPLKVEEQQLYSDLLLDV